MLTRGRKHLLKRSISGTSTRVPDTSVPLRLTLRPAFPCLSFSFPVSPRRGLCLTVPLAVTCHSPRPPAALLLLTSALAAHSMPSPNSSSFLEENGMCRRGPPAPSASQPLKHTKTQEDPHTGPVRGGATAEPSRTSQKRWNLKLA